MPIIDLGEAMKNASTDEFWATRAKSIQSYANVEQSLARLFSVLSGTTGEIAGIIFFKISSVDTRNKIMEKLFRLKFNNDYNLFRNSLFSQLRDLARDRNEIVHWNVVNHVGADPEGKTTNKVTLMAPAFSLPKPNAKKWGTSDLVDFMHKCDFYSRLCNMFNVTTGNITNVPIPEAEKKPWLDIFAQPIVYPPPEDHPLFSKPQEHGNPSQSFHL
jgi:hypothetical protein